MLLLLDLPGPIEDPTLRIEVDGDWRLKDVQDYLRVIQQLHGLTQVGHKLRDKRSVFYFEEHPWLGGYSHVNFYRWGIGNARDDGIELHLRKYQYSSPGFMEIVEAAVEAKRGLDAAGHVASYGAALYVVGKAIGAFADGSSKAVQTILSVARSLRDEKLTKVERHTELARNQIRLVKELHELLDDSARIPMPMEQAIEAATRGELLHSLKARLGVRRRLRTLGKFEEEGKATPRPDLMLSDDDRDSA